MRIGLIGSGWMGAFHAESIARRVPGAVLAAIADPNLESAGALAGALGTTKVTADAADLLADPEIDAVVIASPARFHSSLIGQAAAAGKHVFCEKPAGLGLEELDAALAAVDAAGVHFQIGFNRRYAADFQAAKKDLAAGIAGQPQLLRSLTRDPGTGSIGHAARIPAWTIFLETLIHDFDTLNWFNEGAEPVEVYAVADALVEPGLRDQGFLDTAVVTIRYSNGAIAVAEANFSALYGYDIRGEVFGSKRHGPGRPRHRNRRPPVHRRGDVRRHPTAERRALPAGLHGRARGLRRRRARPARRPRDVQRRRRSPSLSRREPMTPGAHWPWRWPASSRSSRATPGGRQRERRSSDAARRLR